MSNRLIQIGRVPLIPDPDVAVKASQLFAANQVRTEQALEMGRAFGTLLSKSRDGIRKFANLLERANQIQRLSTMSDEALASMGIRRDQLPQLYMDRSLADLKDKPLVEG